MAKHYLLLNSKDEQEFHQSDPNEQKKASNEVQQGPRPQHAVAQEQNVCPEPERPQQQLEQDIRLLQRQLGEQQQHVQRLRRCS